MISKSFEDVSCTQRYHYSGVPNHDLLQWIECKTSVPIAKFQQILSSDLLFQNVQDTRVNPMALIQLDITKREMACLNPYSRDHLSFRDMII